MTDTGAPPLRCGIGILWLLAPNGGYASGCGIRYLAGQLVDEALIRLNIISLDV